MSRLLIALLMGVCAAVLVLTSGATWWVAALAGLIAAGLAYALRAP